MLSRLALVRSNKQCDAATPHQPARLAAPRQAKQLPYAQPPVTIEQQLDTFAINAPIGEIGVAVRRSTRLSASEWAAKL